MNIFRLSNIYFALALIIFAASVAYGAVQWTVLREEKAAITADDKKIRQLEDALQAAKTHYETVAGQNGATQEQMAAKLRNILPLGENYTDLTRELDRYFEENDSAQNPIFQSSLRIGKGAPVAELPDVSALPFSMNVDSTRDNFFKFLNYVNNSGSLETGTRLMGINSIQINFPEEGEAVRDARQKINFTVDMNAYYKTPRVER